MNGARPVSALQVLLNYTDKRGDARTTTVGTLPAGSSCALSPQLMLLKFVAPPSAAMDRRG